MDESLGREHLRGASFQATAWTPDSAFSGAVFLQSLYPAWSSQFSGEPVVLPQGDLMPPEVPRVILESPAGDWKCEVAPGRINIFWRRRATGSEAPTLTGFFESAGKLLGAYGAALDVRFGRLAGVVKRFALHDAPGAFLAEHFCRDDRRKEALKRVEGFELHAHKRFVLLPGLTVNSWVRNKSGYLTDISERRPLLIVEQDINTLAEEAGHRAFSDQERAAFFTAVAHELDVVLDLYYPRR